MIYVQFVDGNRASKVHGIFKNANYTLCGIRPTGIMQFVSYDIRGYSEKNVCKTCRREAERFLIENGGSNC